MQIQYLATGHRRDVSEPIGRKLIANRIAKVVGEPSQVYQTREMVAQPLGSPVSPRTGKPKRQYRRRDMQAEG